MTRFSHLLDRMDIPMTTLQELRGNGSPKDALEVAMLKGVSSGRNPTKVGDYNLVYKTDTTAFYSNGNEIVMAVRGVRKDNPDDRATALSTIYNGVPDSKLYKEDEKALLKMRAQYPGLPVHGVGHSLGGAIVDSLMDNGLIESGHSYNPAVQPRHFINPSNHSRTYNEGDILHKLYDIIPIPVPNREILPSHSIFSNPIDAHRIESFEGGSLPGFLCRVGSKKRFAKLLAHIAPPHDTYVEPFVGSGAFYWYKDPSKKEVVNDLEPDIAKTFRLIKKAPTNLSLYPQNLDNKAKLKKWFMEKHTGVANELTRLLIKHCGGWMGKPVSENTGTIARETNPFNKLKHIADYKERMKNTTVLSEDYAKVIKKYNKADTFFFLDPPYENSEGFGYAEEASFDFEKLKQTLGTIKGHWLMTINDSPNIRALFKGYHIYPVLIIGHKRKYDSGKAHIGSKDRAELLISNYKLPIDWKKHSGKSLVGKGVCGSKMRVAPAPMSDEELRQAINEINTRLGEASEAFIGSRHTESDIQAFDNAFRVASSALNALRERADGYNAFLTLAEEHNRIDEIHTRFVRDADEIARYIEEERLNPQELEEDDGAGKPRRRRGGVRPPPLLTLQEAIPIMDGIINRMLAQADIAQADNMPGRLARHRDALHGFLGELLNLRGRVRQDAFAHVEAIRQQVNAEYENAIALAEQEAQEEGDELNQALFDEEEAEDVLLPPLRDHEPAEDPSGAGASQSKGKFNINRVSNNTLDLMINQARLDSFREARQGRAHDLWQGLTHARTLSGRARADYLKSLLPQYQTVSDVDPDDIDFEEKDTGAGARRKYRKRAPSAPSAPKKKKMK